MRNFTRAGRYSPAAAAAGIAQAAPRGVHETTSTATATVSMFSASPLVRAMMIGPASTSGMKISTPAISRNRRPPPSPTESAAIVRDAMTAVRIASGAATTHATSDAGVRAQVATVARAATEVTIPGMPHTPAKVSATIIRSIVMGKVTSRSGSSVVSTPATRTGPSTHPSVTRAPTPTTIADARSSGAEPSSTSPRTAPPSIPSP